MIEKILDLIEKEDKADLELERQADLDNAADFRDGVRSLESLEENFLNEWGSHEALDRTNMQASVWSDFITQHPFILLHPKLYYLSNVINHLMGVLYSEIGQQSFDYDKKTT